MRIDLNNAATFCLSSTMFGEYLQPKLMNNATVRACFEASKQMGHSEDAALRFMLIHMIEGYEALHAELLQRAYEQPAPIIISR